MTDILLVVGDALALTPGDLAVIAAAENNGHTVTAISDETAEPSLAPYGGLIICESCGGSTVGNKYVSAGIPVLCFEGAQWAAFGLSSIGGTNATTTSFNIAIEGNPCAGGLLIANNPHLVTNAVGTVTTYIAGTIAPDAVLVAYDNSDTNPYVATLEAGDAKQGGGTVEAKRVFLGFRDPAVADLTAAGQAILDGCIVAAFGTVSSVLSFDMSSYSMCRNNITLHTSVTDIVADVYNASNGDRVGARKTGLSTDSNAIMANISDAAYTSVAHDIKFTFPDGSKGTLYNVIPA